MEATRLSEEEKHVCTFTEKSGDNQLILSATNTKAQSQTRHRKMVQTHLSQEKQLG